MARNEEKAQAMLNRFVAAKSAANKDDKSQRPYLASECDDLSDCERYRNQIIKEVTSSNRASEPPLVSHAYLPARATPITMPSAHVSADLEEGVVDPERGSRRAQGARPQ